jgi:ADP-ribosylglycohydrolase
MLVNAMEINNELEDRFIGTLFGQAVGDALGLGTEFMSRQDVAWHYPKGLTHYEQIIEDSHRVRWKKGSWTDDTDQMTMILDSLLETGGVDVSDIARRFWNWAFVANGEGMGMTTYQVFTYPDFIANPHNASQAVWEESACNGAANGGVMRTSVLGLWDFQQPDNIPVNTEAVCRVTHADPRCIGSCVIVSILINELVKGRAADQSLYHDMITLANRYDERIQPFIELALQADDIAALELDNEHSAGYTLKTLSAGIWSLAHADSFEQGITSVILQGGDADTNAAVAGALLGAKFGLSAIPKHWIDGLTWQRYLYRVSYELFARMMQ